MKTLLLLILLFATPAIAHEYGGYKHMKGNTGPIIGQGYCQDGIQLLWIDYNSDGIPDVCKKTIFSHGVLHVKEIPPVDGKCECEKKGE